MKLTVYTTKDTAPASVSFTPAATTSGTSLTLSTASTDLIVGDYIADLAQNEVRKIVYQSTTTRFKLDTPFTSDLTAATVVRVPRNQAAVKMISVAADKGGDITLNGTVVANGSSVSIGAPNAWTNVSPVVVDGSTNNATVLIQ